MSGTIPSSLAGILPASLVNLFDALFTASFRGVEFHMPDVRHETGRRVVRTFFPGRDDTEHEDLGALDGTISVTGLILGDDYIRRARAIDAAFRAPGPGTLVHPWLGEIEVVLSKPAEIAFSTKEMRLARFTAAFEPWVERAPEPLDTLGQLLAAVDALKAEARSLLRSILAPALLPIAALGAVASFAGGMSSVWSGLVGLRGGFGSITGDGLAALAGIGGLSVDSEYPDKVADTFSEVPDAISAASAPQPAPAVGPAAEAAESTRDSIAPRDGAGVLIDAAAGMRPALLDPSPTPLLALAAQAQTLASAAAVASGIAFESRQDALRWRSQVDGALAQLAADAAQQVASAGTPAAGAGALRRQVMALRAAWVADMNERIGRLPSVALLTPPGPTTAWHIAQHLVGDDPSQIVATVQDLVRRNGLRHPALIPAGTVLEVLVR